MSGPGGDHELGFAGMIAAGMTSAEAWQAIRDDINTPEVRAIFADMASTADGRAALECARAAWARHGLSAPWDDLPAEGGRHE